MKENTPVKVIAKSFQITQRNTKHTVGLKTSRQVTAHSHLPLTSSQSKGKVFYKIVKIQISHNNQSQRQWKPKHLFCILKSENINSMKRPFVCWVWKKHSCSIPKKTNHPMYECFTLQANDSQEGWFISSQTPSWGYSYSGRGLEW